MKVPGIWHKKTCTNMEFRIKNLEKTWNLVFEKSGNPVIRVCTLSIAWGRGRSYIFYYLGEVKSYIIYSLVEKEIIHYLLPGGEGDYTLSIAWGRRRSYIIYCLGEREIIHYLLPGGEGDHTLFIACVIMVPNKAECCLF